jgi:hypothetical protein
LTICTISFWRANQAPFSSNTRGWAIEVVAPQVLVDVSLAVDGEDRPHVVYRGLTGLEHAYRETTGWATETVGTQALNAMFPSLALDGSGRPHVLYFDYQSWENILLTYAHRDAGGWQVEPVEDVGSILGSPALALDGAGLPHISYFRSGQYGAPPYEVIYGTFDGADWHLEVVDDEWAAPALELDASGWPHLAYGNTYAYRDTGGWHVGALPDQAGVARSLVLDQAGSPHVILGDQFSLRYATRTRLEHAIFLPLVLRGQ